MTRPGLDAVIIGAGVAGLAAAARLREAGKTILVLEAGNAIGGRAATRVTALGGAPVDLGAQWLHAAETNPLIPLLHAHGETVLPDSSWEERVRLFDRSGRPAPPTAMAASEQQWTEAVEASLRHAASPPSHAASPPRATPATPHRQPPESPPPGQPAPAPAAPQADMTLRQAAAAVTADPWTASIETWEGAIIAAADSDVLSARDWQANALHGGNGNAPGGLGAALSRVLGKLAGPVRLNCPVRQIEPVPGGVILRLDGAEPVEARAAIVTVSTGVLRAGGLRFAPALPPRAQAALDGLPMGLLSKIILRAAGAGRLGLAPGTVAFRQVAHANDPALSLLFWPQDSEVLMGFIGGRAAWALEGQAERAGATLRAELAALFGPAAPQAFLPGTILTGWGSDPLFLGAYAYAVPGAAGARAILAEPLWDGRLLLAGEACAPDGLAGTVAGAYVAGRSAAEVVLESVS